MTEDTYWARTGATLLAEAKARPEGLTDAEVRERRARFGPNVFGEGKASPTLDALRSQLANPLAWLLLFAAAVSGVLGEWSEAGVVVAILLLGGILSFSEERRAGIAVEKLRARIETKCRVMRDGKEALVPQTEVVPGDIVIVSAGSLVPADCVLLSGKDCFVSQSALTGEAFPVEKIPGVVAAEAGLAERTNVVFLGTSLRSGTATLLVVRTGKDTVFGALAKRLVLRAPMTEFELGLKRFGYLLTRIMVVLVFIVLLASAFRHHPFVDSLLFAVALAVGLAPEMLPAILAVTLSHGARAMAARGVIVRHLPAIENFGSMDVLCTDKTGTLTDGQVELEGAFGTDGATSARALMLAGLNARLQTGLANPLDEAIQHATAEDKTAATKLDEVPFDFVRKRMTIAVRMGEGSPTMITKGAFERVLEVCRMSDEARAARQLQFGELSAKGMRVLGVATRELTLDHPYRAADEVDMTFEGMLAFADPPKKGVEKVVLDLAALGVEIKVITGDHRDVARYVATAIGLPIRGLLTGREITALRDDALATVVERTTIFAEVDPSQKERIIGAVRKAGHVVGYMGDGINDAPALHAADVGISVESAVDVAREAADFVLLHQDLDCLRQGIEEGRATFANTMKYVLMTESANLGNMVSMALASLFLPFLPLLAPQVLLNNFLSDLPAMAIARDSVDPEMVARPRRWDIAFVRRYMITFGLLSSVFDGLTFVFLAAVLHSAPELLRTGWFVESLLTELFVVFAVRTRRFFWKSRPSMILLGSSLVVAVVAIALPYTPVGAWFLLVPMPPLVLGGLSAITLGYVASVELLKQAIMKKLEGTLRSPVPDKRVRFR